MALPVFLGYTCSAIYDVAMVLYLLVDSAKFTPSSYIAVVTFWYGIVVTDFAHTLGFLEQVYV